MSKTYRELPDALRGRYLLRQNRVREALEFLPYQEGVRVLSALGELPSLVQLTIDRFGLHDTFVVGKTVCLSPFDIPSLASPTALIYLWTRAEPEFVELSWGIAQNVSWLQDCFRRLMQSYPRIVREKHWLGPPLLRFLDMNADCSRSRAWLWAAREMRDVFLMSLALSLEPVEARRVLRDEKTWQSRRLIGYLTGALSPA